jgi:hypothetical protein
MYLTSTREAVCLNDQRANEAKYVPEQAYFAVEGFYYLFFSV